MNKMIRTFALLAALGAGSTALLAQPAVKLVTVDVAKAYDAYYKSEESTAKFRDAENKAREQAEEKQKQRQVLVDQYKDLVEQAKSALLTPEAKTKAEQAVQLKMEEIQRKQNELQEFVQGTQRSLQQQALTRRELLLDEIIKVVKEIAARKSATVVIDKSGPSAFRIPVVIYADAGYDITDEVVTEINKDRPATPVAAPAATQTAPSSGPATPAPAFTVPNVSSSKTEPAKKP